MAFKPRNKNNGIETVEEVGPEINTSKNSKKLIFPERKNWKDQAIEIINILDSKGINIYDENRTPGMYLKTKQDNNRNILKFLGSNNNKDQQTQLNKSENIENKEIPNNLFNFLINKQ